MQLDKKELNKNAVTEKCSLNTDDGKNYNKYLNESNDNKFSEYINTLE